MNASRKTQVVSNLISPTRCFAAVRRCNTPLALALAAFLVVVSGCATTAGLPGGEKTPTAEPAAIPTDEILPAVVIEDPAAIEARIAQENDAKYDRGRMGFLFGFYNLARDIWIPLANEGHAKAQANLAWMYQTGKGVDKDLKLAYEWYLKAALQNHIIAKNNLGVMYEKGWGVRQNNRRAVYWYRDAAAFGYAYSQYNLGRMLLDGIGTEKNPKEAAYWLGLAAVQGVDDAKGLLIDKAKWGAEQQHSNVTELQVIASAAPKQHQLKEISREPWILKQPATAFTLQLLSSKDENVVTQYLADPHMPDPSAYFKSNVLGEDWYSVVYGVFTTFEEAQKHMRLLPPGITRYKPWVRKFADVHGAIQNPVE